MLINPYIFNSYDANAQAYITAVETADGQELETAVKNAINAFVVGCKADAIWTAIKASCILAGARTLAGALVPLVGTAPTSFNFVSGDYDRKTGLVGNGSNKYLNTNRSASADPQNSHHMALYLSSINTVGSAVYCGAEGSILRNTIYSTNGYALRQNGVYTAGSDVTGLRAASRSSSTSNSWFAGSSSGTYSFSSGGTVSEQIAIFCRNDRGSAISFNNARIAFYSIGESLNLATLNSRVTKLINALAAAIP